MSNKKLITDKALESYLKRFKKIKRLGYSDEGDKTFIEKYTVISEQVHNLHVKALVNGHEIECDEPKDMGGTGKAPNPLETLLASMANCLELTAMMFFSFLKLDVSNIKVEIQASYDKRSIILKKENTLPGLYGIHYTWYIDTSESQDTITQALQKVEESCPVKWTLQKEHAFSQKIVLNNNQNL
ncbi:MAG: OsmC family peroxiredoxin [Promethearchaeota archaeon]|nr:MAG: OsmC family peroxiredoxin [Candidatus Lokiarchaeota archaeon]